MIAQSTKIKTKNITPPKVGVNKKLKNILKNIPKAVAHSVLSPKIVLPIFVLLAVIEASAKNTINQAIQSVNNNIQSANNLTNQVNIHP